MQASVPIGKLGDEIQNTLLGVWCVLKKRTETNSHASYITLTVRETEPSLLSFVAIFFQAAPVWFWCVLFIYFFHNRNRYPHITYYKLFYKNYGNMGLL